MTFANNLPKIPLTCCGLSIWSESFLEAIRNCSVDSLWETISVNSSADPTFTPFTSRMTSPGCIRFSSSMVLPANTRATITFPFWSCSTVKPYKQKSRKITNIKMLARYVSRKKNVVTVTYQRSIWLFNDADYLVPMCHNEFLVLSNSQNIID